MSALANAGLGRTRSLRNPSKSPLTTPTPNTSALVPSTTSHVSLFLTNLRLLDLDQERDWPSITPATFSTKDAAGGLKNRIKCVEWALYHLFVLWDGEEAKGKLKPFYPPLDQVQSMNLRAALLRCLELVKRSGLLGRDAVLRKTMLDECKGERFEEVLAVFSSAVLKKLVAERALNSGHEYRPTFSEKIALENYGYSGERTELNGLLLAHKASLKKFLADKIAARGRYRDFEDLVALKQRNLARKKEQIKAAAGSDKQPTVSDGLKKQTVQIVKTNWTGNDQWAETLLYDDTGLRQGGLLTADFDGLWTGVKEGRLSDLEDKSTGLLEQLDQRVRLQRSRLEKWQGFRQKLFGDQTNKSADQEKAKDRVQAVNLGFIAHRNLQPIAQPTSSKPSDAPAEYAVLLESMRTELQTVGKPQIPNFFKLRGDQACNRSSQHLTVANTVADPISDLSEWEDEPEEEEVEPVSRIAVAPNAKGLGRTNSQPARAQSLKRPVIRQRTTDDSITSTQEHTELSYRIPYQRVMRSQPSTDGIRPTFTHSSHGYARDAGGRNLSDSVPEQKVLIRPEQKVLTPDLPGSPPKTIEEPQLGTESPPRPVSPTQAMADQILASMSNASPSPSKKMRHTLSLAERTRMTMTRTSSFDPDDEQDPNLLSPSVARSIRKGMEAAPVNMENDPGEKYEDLIARTRRSMAGFEAAKQKAQLERRRSERKGRAPQRSGSHFPKVEEEVEEASVIEELLETKQDDMEAIFRSRPKMRTSPAPSPHRRWDDEEYET
ncbi:putative HAUS augmin-like complex subunit 6 N-terminus-domain-containing protein [Seiridium cardinale]|uniref:HAUS augmin-like complex subunit 6 N-terminus-domain-containing protein n=1 Tax=Seiridium cardinale TaxID=138064 RepID=A0ABR2XGR8_9PEZI